MSTAAAEDRAATRSVTSVSRFAILTVGVLVACSDPVVAVPLGPPPPPRPARPTGPLDPTLEARLSHLDDTTRVHASQALSSMLGTSSHDYDCTREAELLNCAVACRYGSEDQSFERPIAFASVAPLLTRLAEARRSPEGAPVAPVPPDVFGPNESIEVWTPRGIVTYRTASPEIHGVPWAVVAEGTPDGAFINDGTPREFLLALVERMGDPCHAFEDEILVRRWQEAHPDEHKPPPAP
jgi:hypothetical protein